MSNSNTTQETLEIMKESEKKLVEESVNKNKFISKTPSKEEIEKESEDSSLRQETQVRIRIPCAFFSAKQKCPYGWYWGSIGSQSLIQTFESPKKPNFGSQEISLPLFVRVHNEVQRKQYEIPNLLGPE